MLPALRPAAAFFIFWDIRLVKTGMGFITLKTQKFEPVGAVNPFRTSKAGCSWATVLYDLQKK
jgi:hypothetical protein